MVRQEELLDRIGTARVLLCLLTGLLSTLGSGCDARRERRIAGYVTTCSDGSRTVVTVFRVADEVWLSVSGNRIDSSRVKLGERFVFGRLRILESFGAGYYVSNDGYVLGGLNLKTGERWGVENYRDITHGDVGYGGLATSSVMLDKQVNPQGTLPSAYVAARLFPPDPPPGQKRLEDAIEW